MSPDASRPATVRRLRPAAGSDVRVESEVRRSRFIALVRRAETEQDARTLLADARAEFPDARHHCSAWILGVPGDQPLRHSSDDGEPSGTAGRPMLDVIDGAGLSDVASVVVRYFGGTLLGTGGLVRAYSAAVAAALARVTVVEPVVLSVRAIALPHADAGRIEAGLRGPARSGDPAVEVLETAYRAHGVRLRVATADTAALDHLLASLTGGTISAEPAGTIVVDRAR